MNEKNMRRLAEEAEKRGREVREDERLLMLPCQGEVMLPTRP
jgi:hypothetical protein